MFFLVRSAFWLGIVYSAMPFDNTDQARELARLRAELAAAAGTAAISACDDGSISCRALAAALPELGGAARDDSTAAAPRSVSTLTVADLKAPWRGGPQSRERRVLAKRGATPI